MSPFSVSRSRLRAALLIAAAAVPFGAQSAIAAPWDQQGGRVAVQVTGATSKLALRPTFVNTLTATKTTVTPRSGATLSGGIYTLPAVRAYWWASDRTVALENVAHRGTLEFRGRNGVRVGLGNLRLGPGNNGFADVYVNGSRWFAGLPVLRCPVLTNETSAELAQLLPEALNSPVPCPLTFANGGDALVNALVGARVLSASAPFAYVSVLPRAYEDWMPLPPNAS